MKKQFAIKPLIFIVLVMMLSAGTNAQIVYTDVNPDVTYNTNGSVYALDLNNDGITDFNITFNSSVISAGTNRFIMITPLGANKVGNDLSYPYPSVLSLNDLIDSSSFSWLGSANQHLISRLWFTPPIGSPVWQLRGNWNGASNKYVPLQLILSSQKIYGWARLDAASNAMSFTVKDYAYNPLPNQSILAGDTSCILPTVTLTPAGTISFCNGDSVQLNAVTSSVNTYQWFKDGNAIAGADTSFYTASSAGVYYVTVGNNCGYMNSAVDTVSVFINDTSVTTSGSMLTSNAPSATYQWMNCSTAQIIPGANSQSFSPSQSGTFAVIVTENGCSDTSSCYSVTPTGIYENISASSVMLFPNPATNQVTIDVGSNSNQVAITISDMTGKIIYTTTPTDLQKVDVNTSNFAEGLYMVQIEAADFITTKKLVVKK